MSVSICRRNSRLDLAGADVAEREVDEPRPVAVVAGPRRFRTLLVVGDEVLERGRFSVAVDAVAAVGQREQQDAAGPEHAHVRLERADRVLAVLEEVRGDHEVLASIRDGREALAVIDAIHVHEGLVGQLRVLGAQLCGAEPVDVLDLGRIRDRERAVQRAELDPLPGDRVLGDAASDLFVPPQPGVTDKACDPHWRASLVPLV
jgi:hypothetical protein